MNDEIRQYSTRQSAAVSMASGHGPGWAVVCLIAIVAIIAGCSDSTDPGGGGEDPPSITFSPVNQGQSMMLSDSLMFSATVNPDAPLAVSWRRGGAEVGTGSTYLFKPAEAGPDTLWVEATAGTSNRNYYWVVTVAEDPSSIPPAVPNVVVGPGPLPSEVEVSWNRIPASTFPIQEYIVAFRTDGAVTMDNWETSTILGTYPVVGGQVGYAALADSNDGMPPGERVWFGVRGRDSFDQLSIWNKEHSTEVTWPWDIVGKVVLLDKDPDLFESVIVESIEPAKSVGIDFSGNFSIGDFRNIDEVTLITNSKNDNPGGWYDFRSQPYRHDEPHSDLVLIKRYGMAQDYCAPDWNKDGDFLNYLREMTRTREDLAHTILYRWESYPLAVYIQDGQSSTGVDMAQAAREAFGVWNSEMGEDYFIEVADPTGADVVFVFDVFPDYPGLVKLVEPPPGGEVQISWVVPEKVHVEVDTENAPTLDITRATCLHELGHVLGLWNHSTCAGIGYLMTVGGGGFLDWDQPIHPDEMNGVRTIRYLPQGTDMKNYQDSR